MRDPERAARIDQFAKAADVEQMVQAAMVSQDVTAAELARRINAKPPQVSRDLHGGLRRATLARLAIIAEALGYEFVPVLVPRKDSAQRDQFFKAYRALLLQADRSAAKRDGPSATPPKRKPGVVNRRRKVA